jgi:ribosomal protein L37E
MIDVASAAVALVAGVTSTVGWWLLHWRRFDNIDHYKARIERVEKLVKKIKKETETVSCGPFRTAPVGDPNTTSPLPEPTPPSVIVRIFPWETDLTCPVCAATNMKMSEAAGGHRNTKTHTICNGCDVHPTPHLHVTCWDCGFKFAVKSKLEAEVETT